jgi:hypothetical protein
MKRVAPILAALVLVFVASAAYAPCFYPHSRHVDYWQHHSSCEPDCHPFQAYTDWWSLDGTCDTDCDGNMTCDGDTHVDSATILDVSFGPCDPICD